MLVYTGPILLTYGYGTSIAVYYVSSFSSNVFVSSSIAFRNVLGLVAEMVFKCIFNLPQNYICNIVWVSDNSKVNVSCKCYIGSLFPIVFCIVASLGTQEPKY